MTVSGTSTIINADVDMLELSCQNSRGIRRNFNEVN